MLVVSAEDWPGTSPKPAPGRSTCSTYLDALAENGVAADVYDVDAHGRTAPDQLGVLSHYDGVIWYTGDDVVTRRRGPRPGQRRPPRARRDARDARLHGRGRPRGLHGQAGRDAVHRCRRRGQPVLRPEGRGGLPAGHPAMDPRQCLLLRGSTQGGDQIQDVLQYWFGGMVQISGDGPKGTDPVRRERDRQPVRGARPWSLTDPERENQDTNVVVRDDERHPAGRASTRSSRAGPRRAGRSPAGRSTRTRAASTCTRSSPTRRTSG